MIKSSSRVKLYHTASPMTTSPRTSLKLLDAMGRVSTRFWWHFSNCLQVRPSQPGQPCVYSGGPEFESALTRFPLEVGRHRLQEPRPLLHVQPPVSSQSQWVRPAAASAGRPATGVPLMVTTRFESSRFDVGKRRIVRHNDAHSRAKELCFACL